MQIFVISIYWGVDSTSAEITKDCTILMNLFNFR